MPKIKWKITFTSNNRNYYIISLRMFVMLWQSYETGDNHGIKSSPKQTQLEKDKTIFRNI